MARVIVPQSKPQAKEELVRRVLERAGVTDLVALVGVRGYYRDTMGNPGTNDRGIYDDAMFLVTPAGVMRYNANTDPSVARRGVAVLKTGLWRWRIGIHGLSKPKNRQYKALVQAMPFTVVRDGIGEDTGWFGINGHKGSLRGTSSLGCQTIYPTQWDAFIVSAETAMKEYGQKTIPYLLMDVADFA
jgi:lysozyme